MSFILGLLIGSAVGVTTICLCVVAKNGDRGIDE